MEPGSFPFSVSLSKLVDQMDRRPKHHACPNVRTQKKKKVSSEKFPPKTDSLWSYKLET